jgi:predicted small metal-binding protein
VDRLPRDFEVHARGLWEPQAQLGPAVEHAHRQDAAELAEERAQCGVRRRRRMVRPRSVDQLVAPDRTETMQHEVGEHQAPLAAGKLSVDAASVDLERQRSAQLNPDAVRQRRANIRATATPYKRIRKEVQVAKQINCECGFVARGETEEEVVAQIREHMRSDHPALLSQVSDEDLRGWIEGNVTEGG